MDFENLRIKDVSTVLHFDGDLKRWDAKNRKFHIIGLKLSGSAFHDLGYKSFTLSENCIYFFNQRDDYHVEVEEPGEAFSVHFSTFEPIDTDSFCIGIENTDEFLSLLQKAETASASADDGELSLLSIVYKICSVISHIRQKAYFLKDARILAAKAYMDIHFREQECLSAAVQKSGITQRRFCDLFKNHFNTTPNKYLVNKKIAYAKSLLETGSLSISETASLCGFSDVYYFSRVFKDVCGISPSKWH